MNIHEIEAAIIRLTPQQLLDLICCLQEYHDKADEETVEEEAETPQFDFDMEMAEGAPLYAAAD